MGSNILYKTARNLFLGTALNLSASNYGIIDKPAWADIPNDNFKISESIDNKLKLEDYPGFLPNLKDRNFRKTLIHLYDLDIMIADMFIEQKNYDNAFRHLSPMETFDYDKYMKNRDAINDPELDKRVSGLYFLIGKAHLNFYYDSDAIEKKEVENSADHIRSAYDFFSRSDALVPNIPETLFHLGESGAYLGAIHQDSRYLLQSWDLFQICKSAGLIDDSKLLEIGEWINSYSGTELIDISSLKPE